MPKGSMQLENAIMYLQNALVTIQNEISNEQRYTLLYKFVAKAHIHQMQTWYNEAVAKTNDEQISSSSTSAANANANEESKANNTSEESKKAQKAYGEDGYRYPTLEFPATQECLNQYNLSVVNKVEAKYESLIKNVHFYLAYLCLETADYQGAIRHSEVVLRKFEGRITKKT